MSQRKKEIRRRFREAVLERDGYQCRLCGWLDNNSLDWKLDAHHITPRTEMPGGGYVPENGIALCPQCHGYAEDWLRAEFRGLRKVAEVRFDLRYSPGSLYKLIGSEARVAFMAAKIREQEEES